MNSNKQIVQRKLLGICLIGLLLGACNPDDSQRLVGTKPEPALQIDQGVLLPTSKHTVESTVSTLPNQPSWQSLPQQDLKFPTYWVKAPTPLLVIALNKNNYKAKIIGHPIKGTTAHRAFADNNLDLIIGSGFVTHHGSLQPVGLLKVNKVEKSPLQIHGYTRILGEDKQQLSVVHRKDYISSLFNSALQLGPGIIESGKLDISMRDLQRPRYFRSFIGLCENVWLAGISLEPTHLRTLGEGLINLFEREKMNCSEVVNLAGDRQALLMFKDNDNVYYHGEIENLKASFIAFADN